MESRAFTETDAGVDPRVAAGFAGLVVLLTLLLVVCAVSPVVGVLSSPALILAAVASARRATTARVALALAAVAATLGLAALATLSPATAMVTAPAAVGAATMWTFRRALVRPLVVLGSVSVGVVTVVVAALWPGTALLVAIVTATAGATVLLRERVPLTARTVVSHVALPAGAVVSAGTVALAIWPTTTILILIALAAVVFVWRAPAWALALGILLAGFEGSIKILLDLEPLPLGNREAGAAVIDFVLFAGSISVMLTDRFRTPRLIWSRATRIERVALTALGAWLLCSVLQILQSGNAVRGLQGFRLFQAYTLVALAAAVVAVKPQRSRQAAQVLLAIGLAVGLYAALRIVIGPAHAEREAAVDSGTVISYGGTLRAIGSFSSAVGLASFLAPMGAFGLIAGYLYPRLRRLAWAVAALSLVGLLGSYSRSSLFGLGLGLVCALVLLAATADVPRRRKLVATGLAVAILGVTYGGVQIASHASPQLEKRASKLLNPFADESVQLRFDSWGRTVRGVPEWPMGHGVGTAGGASGRSRNEIVTTDNSFLKVVYEQGVAVAAVFLFGLVATVVLLARRLRRSAAGNRALGFAALSAFVAFLGISLTGEYVEQPGKVVAWALLGLAGAAAFGRPAPDDPGRAEDGA